MLDTSTFAEASDFACASSFANATEDRTPDKSADKRCSMLGRSGENKGFWGFVCRILGVKWVCGF